LTCRHIIDVCCILSVFLTSCATLPPTHQDNICDIFYEKSGWFDDAEDTEKKWGVPIPVLMSFIYQESRFKQGAQPVRKWYLGFIPGPRASSAYGYAQAKDPVWNEYRASTGNSWASRSDFEDAVDFIGWYIYGSHQQLKIKTSDAKRQYLAYHEGRGGYSRGSFQSKKWLIGVANKVANRSATYTKQLKTCRSDLEGWWPFW